MTLWWIGDAVLLLIVAPIGVYLLDGVLRAAKSIVPTVQSIARTAAAGSKDLDAVPLLLTTQEQVRQTVAGVAGYGSSLDVILDDAEEVGQSPTVHARPEVEQGNQDAGLEAPRGYSA